uniref:Uncharacterized protein n=1 Tax=Anguilla anguilla TaxID=7936 RepID=A0A0E9SLS2_ANGAN
MLASPIDTLYTAYKPFVGLSCKLHNTPLKTLPFKNMTDTFIYLSYKLLGNIG